MVAVTATILDGKATRDEIFEDLEARVAALKEKGITPGLGTILVGDDPGSAAYVRGKHNDCAKVGITSIRRDLPADITQEELEATIDELNANPECTGYIVQLPLPKHLDENAALERVDPDKDADGLHPVNLGAWSWARRRRCRAPRAESCTCCVATRFRSPVPTSPSSVVASPSVARSACCSPAAPRTRRSRCATPEPVTWPRRCARRTS